MRSTAVFVGLLASGAVAQPYGHGHHRRFHQHHHAAVDKRANVVTEWEVKTAWITVTELIDDTTTQLITPGLSTTTAAAATTTKTAAVYSANSQGGQFFEGSSSTSSSAAAIQQPVTTSSSSTSVYVAPTTSTSTTKAAPAVEPTTSTYVAPATVAVETPTTTTTAAAAATTSSLSSSGSSGTKYSGDLTYYTLGLGSCGLDDSGLDTTKNIVAVAADLMGAQSNGNPMCGKTITVSAGGVTAQAVIHDKCPGCAGDSIDGSEALFIALFGSLDKGRGKVEWWYS